MADFELGYALSSEEHSPNQLVDNAKRAEEVGFTFSLISDHYHPWVDAQGHAAFVWSVLGGIARETTRLRIGTGVTCPMIRTHPAIIAQAAATTACMFEGRFFLGVGSGENLNEHILGDHWPAPDERLEMLEESVEVMRLLWQGGYQSHHGRHYTVENARIYTRPDTPPPVHVSAFGPKAFDTALRIGDGFISTRPDAEHVSEWKAKAGSGKPAQVGYKVCVAPTEDEGVEIAHRLWRNSGLPGELSQVLPSPKHFEQASELVTEDMTRDATTCGPDVAAHVEAFRPYADAGFDEVYVANMGPHHRQFFDLYRAEVLPALRAG